MEAINRYGIQFEIGCQGTTTTRISRRLLSGVTSATFKIVARNAKPPSIFLKYPRPYEQFPMRLLPRLL